MAGQQMESLARILFCLTGFFSGGVQQPTILVTESAQTSVVPAGQQYCFPSVPVRQLSQHCESGLVLQYVCGEAQQYLLGGQPVIPSGAWHGCGQQTLVLLVLLASQISAVLLAGQHMAFGQAGPGGMLLAVPSPGGTIELSNQILPL
jgi:hypothetical protein